MITIWEVPGCSTAQWPQSWCCQLYMLLVAKVLSPATSPAWKMEAQVSVIPRNDSAIAYGQNHGKYHLKSTFDRDLILCIQ